MASTNNGQQLPNKAKNDGLCHCFSILGVLCYGVFDKMLSRFGCELGYC